MSRLRPPRLRSVLVVAVALLVVSSVGVGPAISPMEPVAAADGDDSPCDGITVTVFTSGIGCVTLYDASEHDYTDHLGAYSHGSTVIAGNKEYFTIYRNYQKDSEAAAWMDAEVAVAEAYKNGSSESEANEAAKRDVEDYYSVHLANLEERWATTVSAFLNLEGQNSTFDGNLFVPFDSTRFKDANQDTWQNHSHEITDKSLESGTTNLTLANGTTMEAKTLEVDVEVHYYDIEGYTGDVTVNHSVSLDPTKGIVTTSKQVNVGGKLWDTEWTIENWNIKPPDATDPTRIYLDLGEWSDRWNGTVNTSDGVKAGVNDFVTATYADYGSGELNATDILSRLTLAQEYRLEAGNESAAGNETFNSVLASLRVQGFETAPLNETGSFNVTYRTNASDPATERTETGFLFARTAPNGTLEAGATYHVSDDLGSAVFVTETGETRVPEGDLTINSIKDRDGTELTNVSTTSVNYEVANTSEYRQTLEEIGETLEEIEDTQTGSGSPDGDAPGSGSLMVGLVVLAAVALLVGRGGGR